MPVLPRAEALALPPISTQAVPTAMGTQSLACAYAPRGLGLTGLFWACGGSSVLGRTYSLSLEAQAVATQLQFASYISSHPRACTVQALPATTRGVAPFSSPEWLVGVSPSRPGRPFNATADLINFANGGAGLAYSPWDNVPVLFNWFQAWSVSAARAGAPTYKLWRGGLVRRPHSSTLSPAPFTPIAPTRLSSLTAQPVKNTLLFSTPRVRLYTGAAPYAELAPAVLDAEWVSTWAHTAVITPAPYEDVDPLFIHRR